MAPQARFDPYYKWLGIPPRDQPPHHYRLLGLELFESDRQVIENAADQRALLVRSFQKGPHAAVSQQILNEIARARVCLLDPQTKAEYDPKLRGRLGSTKAAGLPQVQPGQVRPDAGLMKTEPTALAAGDKGVLVQPIRPEASAYGSQGDAFLSAQPDAVPADGQTGGVVPPPVAIGRPERPENLLAAIRLTPLQRYAVTAIGAVVATFLVAGMAYLLIRGWAPPADGQVTHEAAVDSAEGSAGTDQPEGSPAVPPVELLPVAAQTVDEGELLEVRVRLADADAGGMGRKVVFHLDEPVPEGASMDASTGVLTWAPSEAQGPGTYQLKVSAHEPAGTHAERTISVTVREVNQKPSVVPIPPREVVAGEELALTVEATDADLPANELQFRLLEPVPGVNVDAATGRLQWTPSRDQADKVHVLRVGVYEAETGASPLTVPVRVSVLMPRPKITGPAPGPTRLLRSLEGHRGAVYSVAISPDGLTLASGGADGAVRLWDLDTGEPLGTLRGHRDEVRVVAFSLDGRLLVSGSQDGTLIVWRVQDRGKLHDLAGHENAVTSLTFLRDMVRLASGGKDGNIHYWDLVTGGRIKTEREHEAPVLGVAALADDTFASISEKRLRIRDYPPTMHWLRQYSERDRSQPATRLVGSVDGTYLAYVQGGCVSRVWVTPGRQGSGSVFTGNDMVYDVALSPDGRHVFTAQPDGIGRWDWHTGRSRELLTDHDSAVLSLAVSRDGGRLASADVSGQVKVWRVGDLGLASSAPKPGRFANVKVKRIATLSDVGAKVRAVALSADGTQLAFHTAGNRVAFYQVQTADVAGPDGHPEITLKSLREYQGPYAPNALEFSPDGRVLAIGGGRPGPRPGETLSLFETGPRAAKLPNPGEGVLGEGAGLAVQSLSFSPDGKLIASGAADRRVRVWDREARKTVFEQWFRKIPGQDGWIRAVAFSPDGRLIAHAASERPGLYNVDTWHPLHYRPYRASSPPTYHEGDIYGLAFSPVGDRIATGGADHRVLIGSLDDAKNVVQLDGHEDKVYDVAFLLDGAILTSASADGTIRIWRTKDGKALAVIRAHADAIHDICFSADGRLMAAGSGDQTVSLWHFLPIPAEPDGE